MGCLPKNTLAEKDLRVTPKEFGLLITALNETAGLVLNVLTLKSSKRFTVIGLTGEQEVNKPANNARMEKRLKFCIRQIKQYPINKPIEKSVYFISMINSFRIILVAPQILRFR